MNLLNHIAQFVGYVTLTAILAIAILLVITLLQIHDDKKQL